MVWNWKDYADIIFLNPAQLVSQKTDIVCSKKPILCTFSNGLIFWKKIVGTAQSAVCTADWACIVEI